MPGSRLPTNRFPLIAFAVAVLLVAATGGIAVSRLQRTMDAGDWSRHALEVQQQIGDVLNGLLNAETGQRGYVLTGDEAYLEPYRTATEQIASDLARLQTLAADNSQQRANLARLTPLVNEKLRELAEVVELRRSRGIEAAQARVGLNIGKRRMDEARAVLREMESEEDRLFGLRMAKREARRRQTEMLMVLGNVLALLAMTASAVALQRQMGRRAAAERRTRESEQRLSTTLASIGDAVIATNTAGAVMFMNPVAQAATGWTQADAKGRPLVEVFRIVNEATRQSVENPVDKVLRAGRIVGLANHTILIARDGREIPIDDSAAPIRDGDGEIMGVVLVFRDVGERKQAERDRERSIRAEAANQAKDEFLAVLSHELRSPLNAMLGWVRVLKSDEAQRDRAVEVLERNIAAQTALVQELLDVSRIVSGKLELSLAPVDLAAIVQSTVDFQRPAADEKQLHLSYEPPAGGVLFVDGDRERLHQIIANLLENAIKFTPPGGRVEVALAARAGRAWLSVRDDGAGIAPAFLPHVFERLRQADATQARAHGGLGLGLAIVKYLVERHGGEVWAKSDGPGKGATFEVALPLGEVPAGARLTPAASRTAMGSRLQNVSVLLVEDDTDTRVALTLLLELNGAQVVAAASASDAVTAFERARPMVIVSDISMPGGDGYRLLRDLRARDAARTPAIAMTGLASNEDRAAALDAGFDEHLPKPVDPDLLIQSLRTLALRPPARGGAGST